MFYASLFSDLSIMGGSCKSVAQSKMIASVSSSFNDAFSLFPLRKHYSPDATYVSSEAAMMLLAVPGQLANCPKTNCTNAYIDPCM